MKKNQMSKTTASEIIYRSCSCNLRVRLFTRPIFVSLLILLFSSALFAQINVGKASYAKPFPGNLMENWYLDGNPKTYSINDLWNTRPLYNMANVSPSLTSDWRTPLMTVNQNAGGNWNYWAHPVIGTITAGGGGLKFPTQWNVDGTSMVIPNAVTVSGVNFAPTSTLVKSYSEWAITARRAESTTEFMDVTFGHGMPYLWSEFTGINTGRVTFGTGAVYFNDAGTAQTFPFTGDHVGVTWEGRSYGVFAPAGSTFRLNGTSIEIDFTAGTKFIVLSAMNSPQSLATFYQFAYAVPRDTYMTFQYNEAAGKSTGTFHVETEPLRGTETRVIHGWIPHHYKYTTLDFAFNGMQYNTARGLMKMAAGNVFSVTYDFEGVMTEFPAPVNFDGKYDAAKMGNYLTSYSTTMFLGGDTYNAGKNLTMAAQHLSNASVINHPSAATIKTKLKNELVDWYTYEAGETDKLFAYHDKMKALIGSPTAFGSGQFNDQHFHYGYYVYASAILGMYDPTFLSEYGDFVKMITKEVNNWDRTDTRFPTFRYWDAWEGHSWANGGLGVDPAFGNDQESTSESMNHWIGMFILSNLMNDESMKAAAAFGYMSESYAAYEYWFDRDNQNLQPAFGPEGKIGCIIRGGSVAYATHFGWAPPFMHGIQYLPVTPGSYYLVRNEKACQTEFQYLRDASKGVPNPYNTAQVYQDIGTWGEDWDNRALKYCALFDPEKAYSLSGILNNDSPAEAGISYYQIHSSRALGKRRFDMKVGTANSGVFYNATRNVFTYVAYNPSDVAKKYPVYQNNVEIGTITVPAKTFGVYNKLDAAQPTLVSIKITPTSDSIAIGGTKQFTAQGFDASGQPVVATFTWSATGGTISANGLFTGNTAGTFTINATSGSIKGTASIKVIQAAPVLTTIKITPATASIEVNKSQQFTAQGLDQNGNPMNANFTWIASGGTISATGLFSAATAGSYSVTATNGNISGTATVTVSNPVPVLTSVIITPANPKIAVNQTQQFTAQGFDQNGAPLNAPFTWTTTGGTISGNGLFTGTTAGVFTITATNGNVKSTTTVTVEAPISKKEIPGKIEAENWDIMFGVQTEATTDAGGGFNVGWIDINDYMSYDVNVTTAGNYDVNFRVASTQATGQLQLRKGNTVLATVNVPNTGGWQNWVNVKATIALTQGNQTLTLFATGNQFNVNYMEFTKVTIPVTSTCSVKPSNNEYTVNISADNQNPTLTFVPSATGYGTPTCILYYGNTANGVYPGYAVEANKPFRITAANGETVYFYYTYSIPGGGEHNTSATRQSFKIGSCSSTIYEAENATLIGATVQNVNAGFSGTGYADYTNNTGDQIIWNVTVPATGNYVLDFRYANGSASDRPLKLEVNNALITNGLTFPVTGGWTVYKDIMQTVTLTAGNNVIKLSTNGANGSNMDYLKISPVPVTARIDDNSSNSALAFTVAPNPFIENTTLTFEAPEEGSYLIEVSDISGRVVYKTEVEIGRGEIYSQLIPLEQVAKGVCVVRISSDTFSAVRKLIKQ